MTHTKKRKRQTAQATTDKLKPILVGIGVLVLLAAVGVIGYLLAGRQPAPALSQTASRSVDQPAVQPAPKTEPQAQPAQPQAQPAPVEQPAGQTVKQPAQETSTKSKAPEAENAEPAPDFTIPTLDGNTFTLAEQRGKPVVILFMAYWCPTCVPEAQALAQLHQEYGDKVTILAVDVDPSSSPEALQQFLDWAGHPTYTFAFDKDNSVLQKYKVRALDTTIIIDAKGRIVYRDGYPTPYKNLKTALEKIVS